MAQTGILFKEHLKNAQIGSERMSEAEDVCYVIMPFSSTSDHTEEYWTNHFEHFLKPIIEEIPNLTVRKSKAFRERISSNKSLPIC